MTPPQLSQQVYVKGANEAYMTTAATPKGTKVGPRPLSLQLVLRWEQLGARACFMGFGL